MLLSLLVSLGLVLSYLILLSEEIRLGLRRDVREEEGQGEIDLARGYPPLVS